MNVSWKSRSARPRRTEREAPDRPARPSPCPTGGDLAKRNRAAGMLLHPPTSDPPFL
ncbi:Protein translocase subunit SecA, partial [Clarias magur]